MVKANLQSNMKVPHPTLIAVGISAAISAIVIGIFYLADTSGMFGLEEADAKPKGKKSAGREEII